MDQEDRMWLEPVLHAAAGQVADHLQHLQQSGSRGQALQQFGRFYATLMSMATPIVADEDQQEVADAMIQGTAELLAMQGHHISTTDWEDAVHMMDQAMGREYDGR